MLIVGALGVAHKFIAAGRRRLKDILPGITTTLVLWLVGGIAFSRYLDSFSGAYVTTYGGLATAMVALVFLYWLAAMFLFGGELNGTVISAHSSSCREERTVTNIFSQDAVVIGRARQVPHSHVRTR